MAQLSWYKLFDSKEQAFKELEGGRIAKFFVAEEAICMVKDLDELFAFEDSCPHQGFSFAGGKCEVGIVECPVHKYKFVLSREGEKSPLNHYPIKINDKGVFVGKKKGFWS